MIYRLQQFLILIVHLLLLGWIMYLLQDGGSMSLKMVTLHFSGITLLGAGLIFGTAQWAKYHHRKNAVQLNWQAHRARFIYYSLLAGVAQLVVRLLAMQKVASSNLVLRSNIFNRNKLVTTQATWCMARHADCPKKNVHRTFFTA